VPNNSNGRDHDAALNSRFVQTLAEPATTATRDSRTATPNRLGRFSFWFADKRWEWSDDVYRMHGYEPGSIVPTTEVVLAHKHPDDRAAVEDLLEQAIEAGGSFSSRHRFYDTAGEEHSVIVVADQILDESGSVVGTQGYYIDVTQDYEDNRRDALDETLPKVFEARAEIEQVKGAMRLVYDISDEQAFGLLRWRSQETNTKLRVLAAQLLSDLGTIRTESAALRTQFDHLILTAHERIVDDGQDSP
jgi:hypothetical protein